MKTEKLKIDNIPSVLYGENSSKAYLFVHGQCGNKEEAERFAQIATTNGYQVLGVDLPCHGDRKNEKDNFNPWTAVPEIQSVYNYMSERYNTISLRANSIGAYFSMLALCGKPLKKCLFVSPIVDMEKLIEGMMQYSNVTEKELEEKQEINTSLGQTLSWKYLCYARKNPAIPNGQTAILYGEKDNMTDFETVKQFSNNHNCSLTVMPDGEHWFHTPTQLEFLCKWEEENCN